MFDYSAISFPMIPAWEGIHVNIILVPKAFKLKICLIISGIAGLDSHLKLAITGMANFESVKMVAIAVDEEGDIAGLPDGIQLCVETICEIF